MDIKPETEREIYLNLNNEVRNLSAAIERFGAQLLNLENTKFNNHELRIENLERTEQERKGMWKFVIGIGIFLSIAVSMIALKTFLK